jgi:hypothetical protein
MICYYPCHLLLGKGYERGPPGQEEASCPNTRSACQKKLLGQDSGKVSLTTLTNSSAPLFQAKKKKKIRGNLNPIMHTYPLTFEFILFYYYFLKSLELSPINQEGVHQKYI